MNPMPTLLIVDDTPANLDQLSSLLSRYRCLAATSGEQALNLLQRGARPDLVLLDILMEGIDGYETLRRIREQSQGDTLPVIFISALDQSDDELRGLRLGAVDYIAKPFHPDIVNARVDTHLALVRMRAELAARNEELEEMIRLREDVERITRHDLRSPLGVILASCELLRLRGLDERQEASVRRMEASGHRMLEMINRSLDLYKMETGRYQVTWEPVELAATLRTSVETLASLFTACRVEPAWEAAPDADTFIVSGERTLFYSLFENLVRNAVEASPVGASVVLAMEAENGEAIVRVRNQGTVPMEIRESFFEKYSTAGKQGGTGLGTYSARLICTTLGGQIAMESSGEQGTTLTLRFPLQGPPATP
jgi:two-component system, sensor histidine kinase and response regulator